MDTKAYVQSVENLMNEKKSHFKFALHQNVHHTGFKVNGVIGRRLYTEEPGDNAILYDVILAGRDTRVLSEVGEYFLEAGHLPEE